MRPTAPDGSQPNLIVASPGLIQEPRLGPREDGSRRSPTRYLGLDVLAQALLARLRACDVAMPIRATSLGSTPADRAVLGRRPMPVLVLDQAGCMLGAAGPRQLAAAAGLHRVVADAMTPANRLGLISGADPAQVLEGPLKRDGFAIVRWRGRLLAAEMDDLRCQARIYRMLSDWGRARFGRGQPKWAPRGARCACFSAGR